MPRFLSVFLLPAFGLLALLTASGLHADEDEPVVEPEGLITEYEPLWWEEVPAHHNVEAPATVLSFQQRNIPEAPVALAPDGSIYFICRVMLDHDGDPNQDVILIKYSAEGERFWAQQFDGGHSDSPYCIELDSHGNVYIAGSVEHGTRRANSRACGFVASYSSEGRHRWTYVEEGRSDRTQSRYLDLAFHGDSVYLTGSVQGSVERRVSRDSTGRDILVSRIRVDGRKLWSRQYQADNPEHWFHSFGIDVGSDGRVFVAGNKMGYDDNTDPQDTMHVYGFVMQLDAQGEKCSQFRIGEVPRPPNTSNLKYGTTVLALELDDEGNCIVMGIAGHRFPAVAREDYRQGMYVAKYSPEGQLIWSQQPRLPWDVGLPKALHHDLEGNSWVVGDVVGRIFIIQIDADGNWLHSLKQPQVPQHRNAYGGEALVFDPSQRNLIVSGRGYHLQPNAQQDPNGGLFQEGQQRQPRGRQEHNDPPALYSYVMRIPLLEDLADSE